MPRSKALKDNLPLLEASGYTIRYAPRGASLDLFHDRGDEVLLAGPAGTGKSLSALQKLHAAMSKYPNAKSFMARKTRSSMTNSCIDMFERHVLKPPDRVHHHKQDAHFQYPNGSILAVVGFDDPEKIKSTDWDMGYVQEATELTENDWEMAGSRIRMGVMPYFQLIGDCNPDKPSHWLKKRVDKGLTKMLVSVHEDNPRLYNAKTGQWTAEGKIYLAKLDRLTGARRSRLRYGLWVASEGMVYEDWEASLHQISMSEMPKGWESWVHYWSIDWGHIHPFVWQDWVEHPETGALYRVREIYQTKHLVEDLARWIKEMTGGIYIPRAIICDHDAEDRAVFERHTGYLTLPAYKHIQAGIQAVSNRLKKDWGKDGPGIFLVRDAIVHRDESLKEDGKPTCTEEEFDGYIWDKKVSREANSKKDELPVDKDNHGMDATRYMVAFADNLAIDPEELDGVLLLGDEQEVNISPY